MKKPYNWVAKWKLGKGWLRVCEGISEDGFCREPFAYVDTESDEPVTKFRTKKEAIYWVKDFCCFRGCFKVYKLQ